MLQKVEESVCFLYEVLILEFNFFLTNFRQVEVVQVLFCFKEKNGGPLLRCIQSGDWGYFPKKSLNSEAT